MTDRQFSEKLFNRLRSVAANIKADLVQVDLRQVMDVLWVQAGAVNLHAITGVSS